jgi:hypothetical protein
MPNGAGHLDFGEATAFVGCSPHWLKARMRAGEVRYYPFGKCLWFRPADLLTMMDTVSDRNAAVVRRRRVRQGSQVPQ